MLFLHAFKDDGKETVEIKVQNNPNVSSFSDGLTFCFVSGGKEGRREEGRGK